MTADEKRKSVRDLYSQILGRNRYSQDGVTRQCVFEPYKDGAYYSDCSSSILNAFWKAGVIDWHLGNTATIHEKGERVSIEILNGIPEEASLRIGDCLLFRGNDSSRPLQIGHVELYAGNGKLYGHGSNTPSEKSLEGYCRNRQSQKAGNGLTKGLVEVRRFIRDDQVEIPIHAWVQTAAALYYRSGPGTSSEILGTFKTGETLEATKKCNHWFYVPHKGWCSAQYLFGWVKETNPLWTKPERWWYLMPGYTWPAKTVMTIGGNDYAFDKDGWMLEKNRLTEDGEIMY